MRRRDLLFALAAVPAAVQAQDAEQVLWTSLARGGVALLLRHARTEPGVGDPPGYRLGDCSTQRNLSAEGRRQAQQIGTALAARRVRIDAVLSSQWCRCLETARLAFPQTAVQEFAALNSFFDDRAREPDQTQALRARIAAIRPPGNTVFVTHHVNILALTGVAVGAGEAVLVRPAPGLEILGRLAL